jgi:ribose transport system ATP-binding protein
MSQITKAFNGVKVLDAVDFDVRRGEVHALVGGNGAGKSTLMKTLLGVHPPDGGSIEIDGRPTHFHSPVDARLAGVAMIFQEFSLVPTLTVAQNVFLTREPKDRMGMIDDAEAERLTRVIFSDMGLAVDPGRAVDMLPTAYRQLTEIAKALSQDAKVLIMDEPTSSLARSETTELFALVKRLKERGISIVYISHRMEEVFEVADRITVLRNGRTVQTEFKSKLTMPAVIDAIVGSKVENMMQWRDRHVDPNAEVLLEVRGLVSGPRLQGVDLVLRAGEIVGLAGLMGSGRSELVRAIFGIDRIDAGSVRLSGEPIHVHDTSDAIVRGLALIPEDRRDEGLIMDHSIRDNLLLPLLGRLSRRGLVDDRQGMAITAKYVTDLEIQSRSANQPVRLLSGGNQQKVVLGRWLATQPKVLLMDEPTAGVDIGTKGEIVKMVRAYADAGNGVVFISSELPELLAVSDRIVVLRNGRVERELPRQGIRTEEELHHAVQGLAA